ncbi:MAG: ferritin [Crocinitomicaceae bacterium]|nr:ferritin [Crocinitomicaceae bacterium]
MKQNIQDILNRQIQLEASSSQTYLAMAVWAENKGYTGTTDFLYAHADEERMHMLKLIKFLNERGGEAVIPALNAPKSDYKDLHEVFSTLLEHELHVTDSINEIVYICLQEKDYTTHNFMQWYVSEQLEEEALARTVLDKLKLIGDDKGGLYLFDNDMKTIQAESQIQIQ